MKCPYLKGTSYCTHCGNFVNKHSRQSQCGYRKNPQKCPLIKGTRLEQVFGPDFKKGRSDLLKTPEKPIPKLDSGGKL